MEKTETTTAPPSVTVAEENATGDSYAVVLATQPTADVTVAGHAGTEVSPNPSTLTFTTMNWETAQTVTVTAADDDDATNDSVTLTHSAASADADYNGITVADVTVNDNDNAQVMGVMVAPGNSRLAVNWTAVDNATGYKVQWKSGVEDYNTGDRQASVNSGSTMTYTIPNLINDTEYTVKVIATRTGANDGPPSEEVTGTPATPRVTVSTAALTETEEDANGDSYTVVLATQPTADVTLTVAGHVGTDATPNPSSLTFTPQDWETAQTVTVTAADDADADTTNDSVTLTHSAESADADYDGISVAGVAVIVNDNDTDPVSRPATGGGGDGGFGPALVAP